MFPGTVHVETVVLLSKLNTKQHIEVELNLDELDLTAAESKATYDEIKAYVLEKYGLKVSSLYISQVKRKCGLDVGQNYNLSKKEDAKVPLHTPLQESSKTADDGASAPREWCGCSGCMVHSGRRHGAHGRRAFPLFGNDPMSRFSTS